MFCTTVLPERPIDTDPFCAAHCKIPVIRDVMRQETRMNKLLTPPGSPERWADGIVVCFVGVACFLVYYLIEFDLCGKANCGDLVYMKSLGQYGRVKGAWPCHIILAHTDAGRVAAPSCYGGCAACRKRNMS